MATRADLQGWVAEALRTLGGHGRVVEVAEALWRAHKDELRTSGNLMYTWQYDMRWAANVLRRRHILRSAEASPRGVWELL